MARDPEDLLRRYRPVAPPPSLRARIVEATDDRRTWPWAAAAALLLAGTISLELATGALIGTFYQPAVDVERLAIQDLAAALGGDGDARRVAEAILTQERFRAARDSAASEPQ